VFKYIKSPSSVGIVPKRLPLWNSLFEFSISFIFFKGMNILVQ